VQNGDPHDLVAVVSDDHIVIREFAIGGMAGLLEIDVEGIGFRVVRRPEIALWRLSNGRKKLQVLPGVR
jgi:hypothetical protein